MTPSILDPEVMSKTFIESLAAKALDPSRWSGAGRDMRMRHMVLDGWKALGITPVLCAADVMQQAGKWLEKQGKDVQGDLLGDLRKVEQGEEWRRISAVELIFLILKDSALDAWTADQRKTVGKCLNYAIWARDKPDKLRGNEDWSDIMKKLNILEFWKQTEAGPWDVVMFVVMPVLNNTKLDDPSAAMAVEALKGNVIWNDKVSMENMTWLTRFLEVLKKAELAKPSKEGANLRRNVAHVLETGACIDSQTLIDETVNKTVQNVLDTALSKQNVDRLVEDYKSVPVQVARSVMEEVMRKASEAATGGFAAELITDATNALKSNVSVEKMAQVSASSAGTVLLEGALMRAAASYVPPSLQSAANGILLCMAPVVWAGSNDALTRAENMFRKTGMYTNSLHSHA
jgi:hypothetical protein